MAKFELLDDAPTEVENRLSSVPDPEEYKGRRIRHKSGEIYESDGQAWRTVKNLASGAKNMALGFSRGLTTDLLGAPVDVTAAAMRGVGLPIPAEPLLGSSHLRKLTGQPEQDSSEAHIGNLASGLVNPLAAGLKGVALAGTFFAPTAKTISKIDELKALGKSNDEIYKSTKAVPSVTGITHRIELSDDAARFKPAAINNLASGKPFTGSISDLMQHDSLLVGDGLGGKVLRQQLGNSSVSITRNPEKGITGTTSKINYTNKKDLPAGHIQINIPPNIKDHDEVMKVILHEMQHIIQSKQGLHSGGNPSLILEKLKLRNLPKDQQQLADELRKDGYRDTEIAGYIYKRLGGEVEARAVETRYKNDAKSTLPVYGVHKSKVIPTQGAK